MATPPTARVRWDAERYAAAGLDEPEIEWTDKVQAPVGRESVVPTTLDEGFAEGYRRIGG
jgi:hypothetical protein